MPIKKKKNNNNSVRNLANEIISISNRPQFLFGADAETVESIRNLAKEIIKTTQKNT